MEEWRLKQYQGQRSAAVGAGLDGREVECWRQLATAGLYGFLLTSGTR